MPLFGFGRRRVYDSDPLVGRGSSRFLLSPPSVGLFAASAILAAIALVIRYTAIDVPIINPSYVFEVLLIAYAILVVGVVAGRRF